MRRLSLPLAALLSAGCTNGDVCPSQGEGILLLRFEDAPPEAGMVTLHVDGERRTGSVDGFEIPVSAGRRSLTADAIFGAGWPIPTAYAASFDDASPCVTNGEAQVVTASWSPVFTSGKLWFPRPGAGSQAYTLSTSEAPVATGDPVPVFAAAFDPRGDLWSGSAASLSFFRSSDLAKGVTEPHRTFAVPVAFPDIMTIAFDHAGNLWVPSAVPGGAVLLRYSRRELLRDKPIPVVIEQSIGPFVFDQQDRLWTVEWAGTGVIRAYEYDEGENILEPVAGFYDPDDYQHPVGMAFSPDGSLWVAHWSSRLARFSVDSGALLEVEMGPEARNHGGLVFDEAGTLWAGYTEGAFAGFPAASVASGGSVSPMSVVPLAGANYTSTSPVLFSPRAFP